MKMITVSLRDDELVVIQKLMVSLGVKRHQVVKLAIRRFLFPGEKSNIPLDGAYAQLVGIPMPVAKHPEENARRGFEVSVDPVRRAIDDAVHIVDSITKEPEEKVILKKRPVWESIRKDLPQKDKKELEDLGVK